jgi:metal-responsive CopG/Arc/MetJ family transcriptional regulator
MRTVQMTLDGDSVKAVDRVSKRLRMSRSVFTRSALRLFQGSNQAGLTGSQGSAGQVISYRERGIGGGISSGR